ncbi:hypothetical protein CDD82_415 [Ophiocordyceps australis]|uniref:Secreted protein n=1 Tax=Ophiocordyceps australis TaxID=1399860 RepID=A0A2C5YNV0_9HYPO|nr:hypothetical protein CDD82_415 [Ophiocordyceps australis]
MPTTPCSALLLFHAMLCSSSTPCSALLLFHAMPIHPSFTLPYASALLPRLRRVSPASRVCRPTCLTSTNAPDIQRPTSLGIYTPTHPLGLTGPAHDVQAAKSSVCDSCNAPSARHHQPSALPFAWMHALASLSAELQVCPRLLHFFFSPPLLTSWSKLNRISRRALACPPSFALSCCSRSFVLGPPLLTVFD